MTCRKRVLAAVLAAALLVMMLSCAAYELFNAGHVCCGDDCVICKNIVTCAGVFCAAGVLSVSLTLCMFKLRGLFGPARDAHSESIKFSLVREKVILRI